MKKYIVDEELLESLLYARHKLAALEEYGVDSGDSYDEAIDEYLDDIFDFEDLTSIDLSVLPEYLEVEDYTLYEE